MDAKNLPISMIVIRMIVVGLIALFGLWMLGSSKEVPTQANERFATPTEDPTVLYGSTGIKECGSQYRYTSDKGVPGIMIENDDLMRIGPYLFEHFGKDVVAAMYTHSPAATETMPGQPALLVLKVDRDGYCAVGIIASFSIPIFFELDREYSARMK